MTAIPGHRPADELPYGLLDGMAQEYKNAPTTRTDAAKMADALHYADTEGYVLVKAGTFSPDPLPSQEVPRDEWANIKPGSRVRIERKSGTVVIGTFAEWDEHGPVFDDGFGCVIHGIARVFVLDEPADPDADLIEAMARAVLDNFSDTANGYRLNATGAARDALRVVREAGA